MTARGLIIGAPRSGSGKTTLTLAMLAAFRRRGVAIRAAKSGPDYIDPAFHAAATGGPSLNLDSWAMSPAQLGALASEAAADGELLIVESAMGLFDGVAAEPGRSGAGADLAASLGLPVLLVLDVSGQSQTAAAVARGFIGHAPGVQIAGVVLNRLASDRHRSGIVQAIEAIGLPVLGAVPRDERYAVPERHLGLVQADEHPALHAHLDRLADLAEAHLDLDGIAGLARSPALSAGPAAEPPMPPPGQRIALARDAAFSFIYPHHLQAWRRAGCEIHAFSPLADEPPPELCDVCWLPGGYPELHAGALAAAGRFKAGLRRFAASRPVHGECGGYMALGEGLEDASGVRHEMAGLLSHSTSFARRKMNLGYRRARLLAQTPIGAAGAFIRGHEFHYASLIDPGRDEPLVSLSDAQGRDLGPAGGRRGQVSGAFFHAIAAESDPQETSAAAEPGEV
ncbi:cobyrinate a,c-diamide synthase [Caulobacter sp. 3R27C2-B]|uniref:cobyrinate a,c-diamide synthase n=1 Tax=Caulobacter sp. 3R27C2-B TaxID=2502219 RepID=UPI0010F69B03|nr:cobyrinate a,c-diamide synthase [Caulobacter sp. 3R27C2-B]